jgi:lysophospholipase L1-like esterase
MKNNLSSPAGLNRRAFLTASTAVAGAAGLATLAPASAQAGLFSPRSLIAKNDIVLFQGDSITDMGRKHEAADKPNTSDCLGNGYAGMAGLELLVDRPKDNLTVFNRGVSGNKVFQLADRWDADCLDLKPNVLSILIGVNDIWHTITGKYQGTVEIYERDYRALLTRTFKALPKVKLIVCEPFVLRTGAVTDKWFPEFDGYRRAAKRVADTFHATFIPYQSIFDEAAKYAPPDFWLKDGVHPAPPGASLMALNWLRTAAGKK